jgi:hypothetical protein
MSQVLDQLDVGLKFGRATFAIGLSRAYLNENGQS